MHALLSGYSASVSFHPYSTCSRSSSPSSGSRSTACCRLQPPSLPAACADIPGTAPSSPAQTAPSHIPLRPSILLPLLPQRQRQIELRHHAALNRSGSTSSPANSSRLLLRVLPRKHHLKQRAVRQTPHRLHQLHHLLERYVLVLLRRQCLHLHPLQQLPYRRLLPIHPPATPACSRKIRSASRSRSALDWPPASRSPHPAVPTTAPAAPPIPPATSYITSCPAAGSAPSILPSAPPPA